MAQPAATAGERVHREFRSPSLELLVGRLQEPRRHRVLDLGPPLGSNVEFFSHSPCTLYLEDLHRTLEAAGPPPVPEGAEAPDWDALVARAIYNRPAEPYDIVLGWDLFNYFDRALVTALMRRLSPHCRTGTYLFLMVSTAPEIAIEPARLTISPAGRLVYEPSPGPTRANPRYTPLALERMMPGFHLLHSFLLGEGMQDYLFTYGS